jgi:iron complex transport system ATP-binding protein
MVIHLRDITLRRENKQILDGINWDVEKGEHWVVYGMNGAGKTALLNMLCAYYLPSTGDITVCGRTFGKSILGDELRRRIGIVSAGLQQMLHEDDNTFEIILSGAFASIGLYEKVTEDMRTRAIQILHQLGAYDFANEPYSVLSQGEKQRALLGRALMGEPELLILDEPATGFDFVAREQLLDTIERIGEAEEGPTMVYVTHHINEILPQFTKILLLKDGKVFAAGETKDLLTSEVMSKFVEMPVDVTWHNGRPNMVRK